MCFLNAMGAKQSVEKDIDVEQNIDVEQDIDAEIKTAMLNLTKLLIRFDEKARSVTDSKICLYKLLYKRIA